MISTCSGRALPGGARPRSLSVRVSKAVVAILLVLVVSVTGAQDPSIISVIEASREAQQSVLFSNLPATVTDTVDRVVFHESSDGLILENVSFYRRPYELSDGTLYTQTPPYESDVFVRQIIENPLAERTLVLLPESSVGQAAWAARLHAVGEMERLNADRDVVVLLDSADAESLNDARDWLESFRGGLSVDSQLSLLLVVETVRPAGRNR